ncbi:hypothetical protein B0H12DRAFT_578644 [Mycena haematopus]|nr:hypothetical protein B0H12DRAFT_578644 [Mycena haematopus]
MSLVVRKLSPHLFPSQRTTRHRSRSTSTNRHPSRSQDNPHNAPSSSVSHHLISSSSTYHPQRNGGSELTQTFGQQLHNRRVESSGKLGDRRGGNQGEHRRHERHFRQDRREARYPHPPCTRARMIHQRARGFSTSISGKRGLGGKTQQLRISAK